MARTAAVAGPFATLLDFQVPIHSAQPYLGEVTARRGGGRVSFGALTEGEEAGSGGFQLGDGHAKVGRAARCAFIILRVDEEHNTRTRKHAYTKVVQGLD